MKKPVSRSGRFAGGPAADVAAFSESISFDHRLWRQDIVGSIAHATMLEKIGVLTKSERAAITRGLDQIALDIRRWVRDELAELDGELCGLQQALVSLGEKNSEVIIPGYTHLQRA